MNSLVLIPRTTGLRYAYLATEPSDTPEALKIRPGDLRGTADSIRDVQGALSDRRAAGDIDVLTIRASYGGLQFPAPVIVDESNQTRLHELSAQAPLAVANTNWLIDEVRATFPEIPIALAFETSFFVGLPQRETTYALPSTPGTSARRWGYHGLYHDTATRELARKLGTRSQPSRMLSICLEARPEMAAVLGRKPVMVTGGATEVEGLPGETNCGDIDPAIPLALAADAQLGPEGANLMLTRQSGFRGMLGYPATLAQVLTEKRARIARVREHLLYHMTLAAGAALASLEGLDGIVFSGRYASHGDRVAAYLVPRIERALDLPSGSIPWQVCTTPLEAIVAEAGMNALLATSA